MKAVSVGMIWIVGVMLSRAVIANGFHPEQWVNIGGGYGVNGGVYSISSDPLNGLTYVGGAFSMAGPIKASNIARWNTISGQWSTLGDGIDGVVWACAVDSAGNLYVGGDFLSAGNLSVSSLARWDPVSETWNQLGAGVNGRVNALVIDSDGRVIVGGNFTEAGGHAVAHIARWDPVDQSWSALAGGIGGEVYTLAVNAIGQVIAGGYFSSAGDVAAANIARWDGLTWSAFGSGLDDAVVALEVDNAGHIYAGGLFTLAGNVVTHGVARWDGAQWQAMSLYPYSMVFSLEYDASSDVLYAAGWISSPYSYEDTGVMRWMNNEWNRVFDLNDLIVSIHMDATTNLFVGGMFSQSRTTSGSRGIVRWDGQAVHWLGSGMNGAVVALAIDSNDTLYAGGFFQSIGGNTNARQVAKWNKSDASWTNLGSGANREVLALAVDHDNRLYAGGRFMNIGGVLANHVAMWNGVAWTNLGEGLNGDVCAMAIDTNGDLYVGGTFSTAGGLPASRVACWNGQSWTNLGDGIRVGKFYEAVYALAMDAGSLYAGGHFTNAGGVKASNVAMWNTQQREWYNLGSGLVSNLEAYALATDHAGRLYVGSRFSSPEVFAVSRVALWQPDDASWTMLKGWFTSEIRTMAVDSSNELYVGGTFLYADGQLVFGITRWNGATWLPLGPGVEGGVYAMAMDPFDYLYVGGDFCVAGGKNSAYVALVLLDGADADADLLPDWWEYYYFGGFTNAQPDTLAANQYDLVQEAYVADVDPTDPAATVPHVGVLGMSDGAITLSICPTSPGRVYGLCWTTNLMAQPQQWHQHAQEFVGTGGSVAFAIPGQAPNYVFRTSVRLP